MHFSFYLNGDVKSVTRFFCWLIGALDDVASGWSLKWSGAGSNARDALIEIETVTNLEAVEATIKILAKLNGVTYKPGRL